MTGEYSMKLFKIVLMNFNKWATIYSGYKTSFNQKRDTKVKKQDQRRKETGGMQYDH